MSGVCEVECRLETWSCEGGGRGRKEGRKTTKDGEGNSKGPNEEEEFDPMCGGVVYVKYEYKIGYTWRSKCHDEDSIRRTRRQLKKFLFRVLKYTRGWTKITQSRQSNQFNYQTQMKRFTHESR